MKQTNLDGGTIDPPYWLIPPDIYNELDAEFHFDYDPCPFPKPTDYDGLKAEWGSSSWVNPLFSGGITKWVRKGLEEWSKELTVFLGLN